jgi:alpha-D-xyloside xylohydrolase
MLKCSLMPYLLRAATQAHRANLPMMRAMALEFPGDPTCRTLDRQYMLGDDLLVAPVFHERRSEFYLPEGPWTHLLTGEVRQGGKWFFDELDYFGIPLWIRPNGIVPMGENTTQVVYDYAAAVRLVCGKLDGTVGRFTEIVDGRGNLLTRLELTQSGKKVAVRNLEGRHDFRVELPWATSVEDLEGGRIISEAPPHNGKFAACGVRLAADSERLSFAW